MNFSEEEVREHLLDNEADLREMAGLRPVEESWENWGIAREFDLGEWGRIDLLGVNCSWNVLPSGPEQTLELIAYELKAVPFEANHVAQLTKYLCGLRALIDLQGLGCLYSVTGVIVAQKTQSPAVYLGEGIDSKQVKICLYEVSMDEGFLWEALDSSAYSPGDGDVGPAIENIKSLIRFNKFPKEVSK